MAIYLPKLQQLNMETDAQSRLFARQQTQRATVLLMRCQQLHALLARVRAPGQPAGEGSAAEKWGKKKKKSHPWQHGAQAEGWHSSPW